MIRAFAAKSLVGLAGMTLSVTAQADDFIETNTHRHGGTYAVATIPLPPGAPSASTVCIQLCARDERCVAWTFVRPGVRGELAQCELKSAVTPAEPNPCCDSGVSSVRAHGDSAFKPAISLTPRPAATGAPTPPRAATAPSAPSVTASVSQPTAAPVRQVRRPVLPPPPQPLATPEPRRSAQPAPTELMGAPTSSARTARPGNPRVDAPGSPTPLSPRIVTNPATTASVQTPDHMAAAPRRISAPKGAGKPDMTMAASTMTAPPTSGPALTATAAPRPAPAHTTPTPAIGIPLPSPPVAAPTPSPDFPSYSVITPMNGATGQPVETLSPDALGPKTLGPDALAEAAAQASAAFGAPAQASNTDMLPLGVEIIPFGEEPTSATAPTRSDELAASRRGRRS